MLHRFISIVRWKRFVAFTVFIATYSRGVTLLQGQESAWAEWAVGALATVPGVVFGLLAFRVLKSPDDGV